MRASVLFLAVSGVLAGALPLRGQVPADSILVYEREVFDYPGTGRRDPFRSLLTDESLGVRFEELSLLGVIHHPDPSRSVAVFAQQGSERRLRGRVGQRFGGIRILAIRPRSVDLLVEEFGVARRETLELKPMPQKGNAQ